MGCGKQERIVEGSLLWLRKPPGFEAAGPPSGPPATFPSKLGKGLRLDKIFFSRLSALTHWKVPFRRNQ